MARELAELARLRRVQTSYVDVAGRRRHAAPDALMAILRAFGDEVEAVDDVATALEAVRAARLERIVEPVAIAWDGTDADVAVRLPPGTRRLRCVLSLEDGTERGWSAAPEADPPRLRVPGPLPIGYHRLTVGAGRRGGTCLVISAPRRAPQQPDRRSWGVFAPLYALRSTRSWGIGDLTDLRSLMGFVDSLGGDVVATLPLLATFLDRPFEPSPYSPISRLFWNELYLDVTKAPELEADPEARAAAGSETLRREIGELDASSLVDHRRAMQLKRRVLEPMARGLFERAGQRLKELESFSRRKRRVRDYARFRARIERDGTTWQRWPGRQRDGDLRSRDVDRDAERYHTYVQWLMAEQLADLGAATRGGLYLDVPLGVNPDGYDVWRERDSFAVGANGGAPPDMFFTAGQDWGFPPLHPERIRELGYGYVIDYVRHAAEAAKVLRIDHVMGLHRLWWVPSGGEARDGAYVGYPAEELYAILSLEAHRSGALVVGEDLGTVPGVVRRSMRSHAIHRTYVVQYELNEDGEETLSPVPAEALASLNTHDMPTFAAFWDGLDIPDRVALGLLPEEDAEEERRQRAALTDALTAYLRKLGLLERRRGRPSVREVHEACLAYLARSDARVVVATLEDLWLETLPQNVPGTSGEVRPNWRRKTRYRLDDLPRIPEVVNPLSNVARLRAAPAQADRPAKMDA